MEMEMEFLGYRYYKLNRVLLLSLGLWPYGESCFKQIQMVFWFGILTSAIVTQLIRLFTMEYHFDLILTDLSYAIPSMVYLLKYSTFYVQSQKIKELMEQVRNDWKVLNDEQELEIMKKHAKSGSTYIYVFTGRKYKQKLQTLHGTASNLADVGNSVISGIAYPSAISFMMMPLLPNILDVVMPLNESRTRTLPFLAEYFLDQEQHFYPLLLHMDLSVFAGITTAIATETLFFAYVYHVCALFQIVSHRIQHAFDDALMLSTSNRESAIYVKIINAIQIHQNAIEFFEYLGSTFAVSYFILIILGVASLSINLFRLFQVLALPNQRKELALFVIFVFSHFYYMFVCNYIGQKIIDNSTIIFTKIYDTRWYITSLHTQRLLLFMMQRSMKSCKLVMGGIYSVSLENFTTLASMSVSYFTVIYSVHQ